MHDFEKGNPGRLRERRGPNPGMTTGSPAGEAGIRNRHGRFLAVALVVAVAGCTPTSGSTKTPPLDEPPSASVAPSEEPAWSRARLAPPDGGAAPNFLVAGPDRLVAVGANGGPATAWTSSDGATWTRTPSGDLDRADIRDIRSGGPGFIATGSDGPEGANGKETIWTSEDGVSWNRLPDDPVFGDTLFISAVAPGGPGLVAVGSWMGAWYSSDGSTWERASVPPVPPEVYPGDDGKTPQIYLTDVADRGGRLVATGWAMLTDDGNGDHPVVVVWTSRDGRSWTDVPTPADVFPPDSSISDITAGPDGFVAIGHITVGQVSTPAIWSSSDGRDWRLHRPGPDGLQLSSVAAGDGGYVAVGATMGCTDCASREAVVMTSVDGDTWVGVPSGPEFRVAQPGDLENAPGAVMFEVVAWGSRFAALGEYDGEPTVWVATAGVPEDVTSPAAPAASGALAYILDGDIYVADPDGSNPVRIADGRSAEDCPGRTEYWAEPGAAIWSPDGRYLAYRYTDCSSAGVGWREGVVISDPQGNVLATFPTGRGWRIGWSPDSTRVAVWDDLFKTIGVYGLDGARQTQLTMPSGWQPNGDHDPAWMPDGTSVWVQNVEVPLDGGTPRRLSDTPNSDPYSPDGSHDAYVDHRSLIVARSDGSEPREVFEAERGTELGVIGFSPQGDRILFWLRDEVGEGNPSLWSVGVDGSGARLLVEGTIQGQWRSR
jgi:hypothetical protein